jgi:hypothetical protein
MAIHRENIEHYPGTLADLANELGNLRYDALAAFLQSLAKKLELDAIADSNRGRSKLASALLEASMSVLNASEEMNRAWAISAPYM